MKTLFFLICFLLLSVISFAETTEINYDGFVWKKEAAPVDTIPGYQNAWHSYFQNGSPTYEWIFVPENYVDYTPLVFRDGIIRKQDPNDDYKLLAFLIEGL